MSGEALSVVSDRFPASAFPRLVVFELPAPSLHPWFDKLRAVLLSPVSNGVVIEADTIITPNAESLFAVAETHATKFPLSPMHEDERLPSCRDYKGLRACVNEFGFPSEMRTIPYIHAHLIWNAQSKPFIARVLSTCVEGGDLDCGSDESALNTGFWKEKATDYLCMIDPYHAILEVWENLATTQQSWACQYLQRQNFAVMFLHGSKDPARSENVFNRLKQMSRKRPWVYFNRTWQTNVTDESLRQSLYTSDGCII